MKGPQKTTERPAVYRKDLHAAVAHFLKLQLNNRACFGHENHAILTGENL